MSALTLLPVTLPPVPSPAARRPMDPSRMVQCAWASFRLARLQELVQVAIAELQLSPRPASVAENAGNWLLPVQDPIAEALEACCDELRDASGMAGAEADLARRRGAIRAYTERAPQGWSDAFAAALAAYRRVAAEVLESAFARAPTG